MAAGSASLARNPETWLEVRSPNFIVVTNAKEKQGRRVAYQFEMIRAVFRRFFNMRGSAHDPPVIILATRDEEALKTLVPEYWAKKGSMHPAGVYLGAAEKNYVALRLDVSLDQQAHEPYEPIYHEYVHYLTRRMASQLPLWLVEGLAEFYGNTRIQSKKAIVGAPSNWNLRILHERPPLPLSTLFAVDASSPYYHEENKTSIFYAESWALTHYLITRDWGAGTQHFQDFIRLLGEGVGPELAAQRTIGDLASLDAQLSHYITRFLFTAARLDAPPGMDEKNFQARPLSPAESLAVRGDFLGRDRHYPEAREMLEEALQLDPKLAAAHETMGFLYAEEGNREEATKWYSQAVALNSQSYLANYYYAVSLFKGKLDDGSAAKAEASLRAAIKSSPDFAPAYASLGWLLASRHENPEEAYRTALTAVSLEPGSVHYRLNSAQVLMMIGRVDAAVMEAQRAASMAKTPEERAQAQTVLLNAQEYQEFKKKEKEQAEAFQKAVADAAAREAKDTEQPEQKPPPSQEASGSGEQSPRPPELRHRDEPPGSRYLASEGAVVRPRPARPELLATSRVAEGTIKNAMCSGAATLQLTLASKAGVFDLYSDNFFKLPYRALNFQPAGVINPCTDLKSWHARITYRPAKGHTRQGEMTGVDLVKD
jgi:tetratricopeptide (TPR) repeat protein